MIRGLLHEFAAWHKACVAWTPGGLGVAARRRWCRARFARCGAGLIVGLGCDFSGPENISLGDDIGIGNHGKLFAGIGPDGSALRLGDRTRLNTNVMLNADCGGVIELGRNVLVGPNVVMRASNHVMSDVTRPIREQGHAPGRIVIEDDVWIGANVVILMNVRIGRGAVVGAGAVVTSDVPAYEIYVGNPARRLRSRLPEAGA